MIVRRAHTQRLLSLISKLFEDLLKFTILILKISLCISPFPCLWMFLNLLPECIIMCKSLWFNHGISKLFLLWYKTEVEINVFLFKIEIYKHLKNVCLIYIRCTYLQGGCTHWLRTTRPHRKNSVSLHSCIWYSSHENCSSHMWVIFIYKILYIRLII